MWFMTRIAIVFYVLVIFVTSLAIMLFVLHALEIETIFSILTIVYNDRQARAVVFGIACGIVAVSFLLENLIYGQRRRERTIAFDNPGGQVTVSLSALEDLIKGLGALVPQIKEIRPTVLAIKKGLDIDIKLTLRAAANIPDLTTRLQDLVRRKIEETIGIEGRINVCVHVVKISLDDGKGQRPVQICEPHVPFHGYRV